MGVGQQKPWYRKWLSWILTVCMIAGLIQGMNVAGFFKKRVSVQAASMDVGKYLYLKTSFSGGNWQSENADIFLDYWDGGGSHTGIRFEQVDGDYVRLKVTEGLKHSSGFALKRFNPASNITESQATTIWTKGTDLWNIANDSYKYNDNIVSSGGNVMELGGWDNSLTFKSDWKSSIGGETMFFYNMDRSVAITDVKAEFFVSDSAVSSGAKALTQESSDKWSLTIPSDNEYDTVQFTVNGTEQTGTIWIVDGGFDADTANAYLYRSVVNLSTNEGTGAWGEVPVSGTVAGTLYFDNMVFATNGTNSISVPGQSAILTVVDTDTYQTEIASMAKDTVITFTTAQKAYHFLWADSANNFVTLNYGGIAAVEGIYYPGGVKTIYFDATLSKLSYSDVAGDRSLPSKSGVLQYYATKADGTAPLKGNMLKVPTITKGEHAYKDVYRVMLPEDYTKIAFSNYEMASASDSTKSSGQRTDMMDISGLTLTQPCFYADAGEQSVYTGGQNRGGYWAEAATVNREAETALDYAAVYAGDEKDLQNNSTKYVKTTFFDYFSDLELDGENRMTAGADNAGGLPGYGYTNRTYAPNRIFNRVLSDYYKTNSVASPLYFGHFQWSWNSEGTYFSTIAPDLSLYGYDGGATNSKFLYQNNSNYRFGGNDDDADVTTQGLICNQLDSEGNLQLQAGVKAPYFDEAFVTGDNTYNMAVGKVYKDVTFPFTKEGDYWVFNSKNTNLRMTKDNSGNYFMRELGAGQEVKGYTNSAPTTQGNFFPFNDHTQSGVINKLDYGFGMRMDIDFSLTADGKIGTTPIVFSFSGDDDIWIFIDDKLALDMGGSHGEVSGTLNFATKTAHVSKVKTTEGYSTAVSDTDKSFAEAIDGSREVHTLTIFYMERGLWESNMSISYNFPETNLFTIDKTLNISDIHEKIMDNAKVAANLQNLEFEFGIANLVNAGGATSVADMHTYLATVGFDIDHTRLSDYGSWAASDAQFKPVTGATYSVSGTEKTVAAGAATLKTGEQAVFKNMFRRGSYLMVNEQAGAMLKGLSGNPSFAIDDLFTTTWRINGNAEEESNHGTGAAAKDGRTETYDPVTNGIAAGYLADKNTILYRNYESPASKVTPVDIGVSYENRMKTGSIVLKKEAAAGAELSDSQEYTFTVTLNNIAGLHLEETINGDYTHSNDQTIELGSYTLKKGEQKTIDGIPLGTEYTVVESVPTDNSALASISGGTTVTLSENKVTGVVKEAVADNTLTFYNTIPTYRVKYFTEIAEADYTDDADHRKVAIGGGSYKYFVKADTTAAPTYTATAKAGSTIRYDATENETLSGGILLKEGADPEASVAATYKSIAGYRYNPVTTQKAGKSSDTVATDKVAEVELYYELTSYKERYYVEADNQTVSVNEEDINYIKIDDVVYQLDTTTQKTIELQPIGASKTVTDLSGTTYSTYVLMTLTGENLTKYPKTAAIKADGSTVLYQIYAKHRNRYTERYYLESDDQTSPVTPDGKTRIVIEDVYYDLANEYPVDVPKESDTATVTDRKEDYPGYQPLDVQPAVYPKTDTIEEDGSTVVYQILGKARYRVEYYLQTDEAAYQTALTAGKTVKTVAGKYFVLEDDSTKKGTGSKGDTLAYDYRSVASDTVEAGAKLQGAALEDTYLSFAEQYYRFNDTTTTTNGKTSAVLKAGSEVVVQLFYEKIKTSYKEEYYIQVEKKEATGTYIEKDGKIYKKVDKFDHTVTGTEAGTSVTVTDKQSEEDFANYKPVTVTGYPPTGTVQPDGSTVVYQIFEKKPAGYVVEHYTQVEESEYQAAVAEGKQVSTQGTKYFVLRKKENGNAYAGDTVTYQTRTDAVSGATQAGVFVKAFDTSDQDTVEETFADYETEYFKFNDTTTVAAGKTTAQVVTSEETGYPATIRLYHEKLRAKYTEKYYIEAADQTVTVTPGDDTYIEIGGTIYQKQEENKVDVPKSSVEVTVTDKKTLPPYTGYQLLTSVPDSYPATAVVKEDGTTVVYQIYAKNVATFRVEYYLEVTQAEYEEEAAKIAAGTSDNKVYHFADGKYFIARKADMEHKTGIAGDTIGYGVAVADGIVSAGAKLTNAKKVTAEVAGTYKSFAEEYYRFNEDTTKAKNVISGTLTAESEAVIELYYERIPADYQVNYYVEVDEATYNLAVSKNQAVSKVEVSAGSFKYFVKETSVGPKTEQAGDEIAYTTSGIGAGTKAGVTLKKLGQTTAEPVEDTLKAFSNYIYSDEVTKAATNNKEAKELSADETVQADLYYVKQPAVYIVEYWLQVDKAAYDAVTDEAGKKIVDEKYFVRQTETYSASAYAGDVIAYAARSNAQTGITEGGATLEAFDSYRTGMPKANVAASFKAFDGYEYKEATTKNAGSYQDTVNTNVLSPAVVRLFYEQIPKQYAYYTEKYYIEVSKKGETTEPDDYIEDGGKIYKKNESRVVGDVEVGTEVSIVDKQTVEPYNKYKLVTIDGYPADGVVKKDNSTIVYQIYGKNPAGYTVEYYLEKDQAAYDAAEEADRATVNGKLFVRRESLKKSANVDDVVTYRKDSDVKAGVTLKAEGTGSDVEVTDSFKSYETEHYQFDADSTIAAGKVSAVVNQEGTAVVKLYYDKIRAPYTEKYYIQVGSQETTGDYIVKAGKIYRLEDSVVIPDQEIGTEVTVTDKQTLPPYVDYELTQVDGYPPTGVVNKDGSTVVYQIYEAAPTYTVAYYTETEKAVYDQKAADERATVNGKYFIKAAADVINPAALADTVKYDAADTKTAGVKWNGVAVNSTQTSGVATNDTYRSFAGFVFDENDTVAAGRSQITVQLKDNLVELYYVKKLTHYTEEYYLEVFEKDETEEYITVPTEKGTKIYKKNESHVVEEQEAGISVTVTDKQQTEPYNEYRLIEITGYPKTDTVAEDGSTIVYQIYERKPVYTVEYYVEVDEDTYNETEEDQRDTVDGKFFIKKEMVIKTADVDDEIKYDYTETTGEDKTKAGIMITDSDGTKAVDDTYKAYDNYEFKPGTTENAKSYEDTVDLDKNAKIKLYYESVITRYTEKYYIQLDEEEAKNVTVDGENYVELTIGGKTSIFKKQDQNEVENQKAGWDAEVTSKEGTGVYSEYELIKTTVDGYPKTDTILQDGSTVVYQIYVKKQEPEPPVPVEDEDPVIPTPVEVEDPTAPTPPDDEGWGIPTPEEYEELPEPTPMDVDSPDIPQESVPPTTQPPTTHTTSSLVKTGDVVNGMVFVMLLLSAVVIMVVSLGRKKRQD